MCPRRVPAQVREIEILRNQKAPSRLRGTPDVSVNSSGQVFGSHSVNVVTKPAKQRYQAVRKVLVEFDLQRLTGISASGRSS